MNFFHDITERKRSEQALAERAMLLDLSSEAIPVRDGADRVTYWNQSATELYGYSRGEALGRVTHELLQTEFPEPLERITERLHRDGRWTGELIHRCKEGNQIVVISRWALDRDDGGNRKRVLETNNDITQRKQNEKALQESEDRFRVLTDTLETQVRIRTEQFLETNRALEAQAALLQSREELLRTFVKNVPAGVAMLDCNMRYLQVSDRWCEDFSVDNSQVLGRSHYEIFPDIPEQWKRIHCRALAGETLRAEEDRWDRKEGTTWLRWEIRPWQNLEGVPGGILIFSEDITRL